MSNDRLKFRAWDKEYKFMSPVMALFQDGNVQIYQPVQASEWGDVDWDTDIVPADRVEVMQWTGLYDISGAEIYENDKVSKGCEPFAPEYSGAVKFHHGCWMVMYDDEAHYFNLHFYVEQCKVTGNIYDA